MHIYFILIFIFLCFLFIKYINTKDILSITFWIIVSFSFLIAMHLFGGIQYVSVNFIDILPYVFLCLFLVILGEYLGSKVKSKNCPVFTISLSKLSIVSIIGAAFYAFDLIRLNSIKFGLRTTDQQISMIGTFGNILASLGIIVWLVSFYNYRINKEKIPFLTYLSSLAYVTGGVLTAGRQAIFLISLATLVLFIWSHKRKQELKIEAPPHFIRKKAPKAWGFMVIPIVFVSYFVFISIARSQIFKIEDKIYYLEYTFNAKTSPETVKTAQNAGVFSDLYIESLYYYTHELGRLQVLYHYYDYPPVYGLSELSYVERRLQWLFGNQGELSWNEADKAITGKGKFYSHTWGTFITNFIMEFGRFGAVIACFLIGFLGGLFLKKFKDQENYQTVIRQCLICAGAIFSVQFSPFAELIYMAPIIFSSYLNISFKN